LQYGISSSSFSIWATSNCLVSCLSFSCRSFSDK